MTFFADITKNERGSLLPETAEAAEYFRRMADALPHIVWQADRDGNLLFINRTWYEVTGLTPDETAGEGYRLAIHPEDRERQQEALRRAIERGIPYEMEFRLYQASEGKYRWYQVRSNPIYDGDDIVAWVGTCTSIAAQKRLEEELRQRARDMETLLNIVPAGILIADDADCQRVTGNAFANRVMGVDPARRGSWSVSGRERRYRNRVYHQGKEVPIEELPLQRAAREGREIADMELEWEFPDGHSVHVFGSAIPLVDLAGNGRGAVCAFVDISHQKEAQAQIEALNERLRRAMQETHHRIKNNMQVIAALTEVQAANPEASAQAALQRIGHHVRTLALLHDMLTREMREGNELTGVSAQAILEELIVYLQSAMPERRLICQVEDIELPLSQSASVALVVSELISNADKHGGQQITVILVRDEEENRLEVTDNGPGFPASFDPETASSTGIEIIKSVARWDLRGSIGFQNVPSGGARVTIVWPATKKANGDS